jgi:hypothetical protein
MSPSHRTGTTSLYLVYVLNFRNKRDELPAREAFLTILSFPKQNKTKADMGEADRHEMCSGGCQFQGNTVSACRFRKKLKRFIAAMKAVTTYFLRISVVAAIFVGVASADVDFSWTFGNTSTPTVPYGSGSFDATPVDASAYPGLYQIISGMGSITDSEGTYTVSVAGLTADYGGVQGLCGNVVDPGADCNTMRGVPNSGGANYTFDNLLYTGASQGTGQPFDANGIAFVSGNTEFVLTTTGYSGNGGGALYCGPENPGGCVGLNYSLSVTQQTATAAAPEPSFYEIFALFITCLAAFCLWSSRKTAQLRNHAAVETHAVLPTSKDPSSLVILEAGMPPSAGPGGKRTES